MKALMNRSRRLLGAVLLGAGVLLALGGCEDEKEYVAVGPNWAALHKMQPGEHTFGVTVAGVGQAYRVGDELTFEVRSEREGRLWIVQVDPDDEASLIFPNDAERENRIEADRELQVPPPGAQWALEASPPMGESVLAFIVTAGDLDLRDVLREGLERGKAMDKTLTVVRKAPAWGLARKIIDIRK